MKLFKRVTGVILLCGVILLSSCGKTQTETATTTAAEQSQETVSKAPETTAEHSAQENGLARTVEIDFGEGKAVFEFNEKGLLVSEKNKPWGASDTYYTYDKDNRITEMAYANYDGDSYSFNEKITYDYNSDGKIIRRNTYSMPENELAARCEYKYDNGQLAEKIFYENIRGEMIYTYSEERLYSETEEGTEINFRSVSNDGSVGESTSTYDKSGKLIREDYPGGPGSTEYIYDESGRLIKEIYGYDEQEIVYEYENDLLIKKVCVKDEFLSGEYNSQGSYTEYKYYDNGNIVAAYWCDKTGETGEIDINAIPEVKGNFAEITEF